MGQISTTGKTEKIKYQEFVQNYHFIRKIRDPRYGEISILEDKQTREQVALKEIVSKDNRDFDKEINFFTVRCKIVHPNILRLLGYTSRSEDKLCASFHKIFMIVEYLDNDLEKEISYKKSSSQYYSEQQLWYLAESTIKALALLQKNAIVHGDIKPGNIFISRMGVYKIAEHNLIGNVMPGYNQRLFGFNDTRVYLSPAQMQSLKIEEHRPTHNPWKSDIFSLGMTLMHAATLSNCDNMYNWPKFSIDANAVEQRIMVMRGQYSEAFCNFVKSMLTINEELRPDLRKLESSLVQPIADPIFTVQQDIPDNDQLFINDGLSFDEPAPMFNQNQNQPQSRNFEVYDDVILDEQDWKVQEKKAGKQKVQSENVSVKSKPQTSTPLDQSNFSNYSGLPANKSSNSYNNVQSANQVSRITFPNASNANSMVFSDKILNEDEVGYASNPFDLKESRVQNVNPFQQSVQQFSQVENVSVKPPENYQNPPRKSSNELKNSNSQSQKSSLKNSQEYQRIAEDLDYIKQLVAKSLNKDSALKESSYSKSENIPKPTSLKDEKPPLGSGLANVLQQRQENLIVNRVASFEPNKDEKENSIQHVILGNYNPNFYKKAPESVDVTEVKSTTSYNAPLKESTSTGFNPLLASNQTNQFLDTKQYSSEQNMRNSNLSSGKKSTEQSFQPTPKTLEERVLSRNLTGSNPFTDGQTRPFTQLSTEENKLRSQPTADFASFENDPLSYLPADLRAQLAQLRGYSNPYLQQNNSKTLTNPYIQSSQPESSEIKVNNDVERMSFSTDYYNKIRLSNQYPVDKVTTNDQVFGKPLGSETKKLQVQESEFKAPIMQPSTFTPYEQPRESEFKQPSYSQSYAQDEQKNSITKDINPFKAPATIPSKTNEIKETYSDGSVYVGEKVNGLRHGKGKFLYSDGGMYEGEWSYGSMDGYGILSYGGGAKAYEGEWKQDKFHGRGILYNQDAENLYGEFDYSNFDNLGDYWTQYEGDFDNDHKSGSGVIFLSNGDRYQGQFREDLIHGTGTYITASGKEFKAEWWRNKLVRQFN